jgi:hypothetical protein
VGWINEYITIHPQMSLPNARVRGKAFLSAKPTSHPDAPVVLAIRGKKPQDVARNLVEVLSLLKEQEVIESYGSCALLAYSVKPGQDASPYISALRDKGIPLTFSPLSKDQTVYQQILGTLLLALDRSGNSIPANFAANNASLARYVDVRRVEYTSGEESTTTAGSLTRVDRVVSAFASTHPVASHLDQLCSRSQSLLCYAWATPGTH